MDCGEEAKGTVVSMPARVDAVSAPEIERDLLALSDAGAALLVCDFSATTYVSSAGLRVMLLLTKRQRAAGRRLVLACLRPEVADIFGMAGFDAIMEITDTVPAAVKGA